MVVQHSSCQPPAEPPFRYVDEATPVVFPESAEVPESKLHLRLRTGLYLLLEGALPGATVGSDQFVYWDAEDPSQCLAPDAYVRLTPETDLARSWKVWERGAPDVAVEVISETDAGEAAWQRKLERYRHMGVRELVRFEPEARERSLRIWDRVDGALRERRLEDGYSPSSVLDLYWAVAPLDGLPAALRIATGPTEDTLVPTAREARQAEAKVHRATEQARRVAEARVRELEAKLKRGGG